MKRRVVFSPEARADIRQIYLYIAERSDTARAIAYMETIEAFCVGFADFPSVVSDATIYTPVCAR